MIGTPQQMGFRGWTQFEALPYLDARQQRRSNAEAVEDICGGFDKQSDATPFGVPPSLGTWGGSGAVVAWPSGCISAQDVSGILVALRIHTSRRKLHSRHAPGIQHFVCSWRGYGLEDEDVQQHRADKRIHPGAVIPGYIIIKPDLPECIDDYGFSGLEDEAVVAGSASWVVAGNAAERDHKRIEVGQQEAES